MHQFSNSKEQDGYLNTNIEKAPKEIAYNKSKINYQEAIHNEDILEKVIEMTIEKKAKTKLDKEFYNSLKSGKNQNELDNYCYMNKGANLPGREFNIK